MGEVGGYGVAVVGGGDERANLAIKDAAPVKRLLVSEQMAFVFIWLE